jgi:hypothetical protein
MSPTRKARPASILSPERDTSTTRAMPEADRVAHATEPSDGTRTSRRRSRWLWLRGRATTNIPSVRRSSWVRVKHRPPDADVVITTRAPGGNVPSSTGSASWIDHISGSNSPSSPTASSLAPSTRTTTRVPITNGVPCPRTTPPS